MIRELQSENKTINTLLTDNKQYAHKLATENGDLRN